MSPAFSDVPREPCPSCGELTALGGSVCPFCNRSLLVALAVESVPAEGRDRYQLARTLATFGPPFPAFLEIQRALAPGGVLVRGITREAARPLIEALEDGGAGGRLVPLASRIAEPPPAASRGRRPVAVAAAVVALALGGAAWLSLREPSPESTAATASSTSVDREGAAAGAWIPGSPTSTREIAALATPSTVMLRCGGSLGSGFFVAPQLVLTNAHVLCPPGDSMTAVLSDGTSLAARPEPGRADPWLDLALVRVDEATAPPLPLGDATGLRPGDRIVVIGTPEGLDFSVHEGIVSHTGRANLGVVYLQLDASINPGNSGGPAFDAQGRVVGIVSAKVEGAEGLGFALPINYAYHGTAALLAPPTPAPDRARWSAQLADAARADAAAAAELAAIADRTVLLGLGLDPAFGLVAVVARRGSSTPFDEPITVRVERGGELLCRLPGVAQGWTAVEAAEGEGPSDRFRAWLERHHLTQGLYRGVGPLEAADCPPEAFAGATFALDG